MQCPIMLLTLVTGTRRGPNTSFTRVASTASLALVPVPWALTKSTSSGVSPERAMASRIARAMPPPSGCGRVMWIRVAGEPVAADLGQRRRAPAHSVGFGLEHQNARALAEDEALAVEVEGLAALRREGAEAREAGELQLLEHLRRAGDHHVGAARADEVCGEADGVVARGAGGREGEHHPPGAQGPRDGKSFTCAQIERPMELVSKSSTGPAPDRPSTSADQKAPRPTPTGETTPIPVTSTRVNIVRRAPIPRVERRFKQASAREIECEAGDAGARFLRRSWRGEMDRGRC
jgi:hypothetical protein